MSMLPIFLLSFLTLFQPSKLQRIEEALERVLMTHGVNYERSKGGDVRINDVTYTYTGNTVIDARQDSLLYYVYGTYTFTKYTYVQAPNPLNGGTNSRSFNNTGSRTYLASVKSVLDDYRVQEIIIIDNPEKFDFASADIDSLKLTHDWLFPSVVIQSNSRKSK